MKLSAVNSLSFSIPKTREPIFFPLFYQADVLSEKQFYRAEIPYMGRNFSTKKPISVQFSSIHFYLAKV